MALIAITATTKVVNGRSRVWLNEAYTSALVAAGLVPIVIPPHPLADPDDVLDAVQGLVLSGGEDVAPAEYGAARGGKTHDPHLERDRAELALARRARERRIPTLAICRGIQLVNVALGGTLIQDIPTDVPGALPHNRPDDRDVRLHDVAVEAGSALAAALGTTRLGVNTSHHQAIATPAPGIRVVCRADDGIIEGAEWVGDNWWMLAVQWHPEELVRTPEPWDRNLLRAFAAQVTAPAAVTAAGA